MLSCLFALSVSAGTIPENELPYCDDSITVFTLSSRVFKKFLKTGTKFCIATQTTLEYDGTGLVVVYNDLGEATSEMYLRAPNERLYTKYDQNGKGGAYFGNNVGLIVFTTPIDTTLSLGYTTFQNDCYKRIVTNQYSFHEDLLDDVGRTYCVFNSHPSRQKIEMFANRSDLDCRGMYYPRYSFYRDLKDKPIKFRADMASIGFMKYHCNYRWRRSEAKLTISASRSINSLTHKILYQTDSKPLFFTAGTQSRLTTGAIVGIVIGCVLLVLIAIIIGLMFCCLPLRRWVADICWRDQDALLRLCFDKCSVKCETPDICHPLSEQ